MNSKLSVLPLHTKARQHSWIYTHRIWSCVFANRSSGISVSWLSSRFLWHRKINNQIITTHCTSSSGSYPVLLHCLHFPQLCGAGKAVWLNVWNFIDREIPVWRKWNICSDATFVTKYNNCSQLSQTCVVFKIFCKYGNNHVAHYVPVCVCVCVCV